MNKKTLPFTFLMVAVLILSACGPAATQAPAPVATQPPAPTATQPPAPTATATAIPPKVLNIANTATITTWDPIASFSTEAAYMGNMYEQLAARSIRPAPPRSTRPCWPPVGMSAPMG